jgi:hypothetical protein
VTSRHCPNTLLRSNGATMWRWSGHSKHSFIRAYSFVSSIVLFFHCATHFIHVRWLEFSLQSYVIQIQISILPLRGIHSAHGDQSWLFSSSSSFGDLSHLYVRHYRSVYQTGFFNSVSNLLPQMLTFFCYLPLHIYHFQEPSRVRR